MKNITPKVFVLKTYGAAKYKWSPLPSDKTDVKIALNSGMSTKRPYYCSAVGGSQGEDWIGTYSYDIFITNNGYLQKIAYVECDYVQ